MEANEVKKKIEELIDGCITEDGELDTSKVEEFINTIVDAGKSDNLPKSNKITEEENPETHGAIESISAEEQKAVVELSDNTDQIKRDFGSMPEIEQVNDAIKEYFDNLKNRHQIDEDSKIGKDESIKYFFDMIKTVIEEKKKALQSEKEAKEDLIGKFQKMNLVNTRKRYEAAISKWGKFVENPNVKSKQGQKLQGTVKDNLESVKGKLQQLDTNNPEIKEMTEEDIEKLKTELDESETTLEDAQGEIERLDKQLNSLDSLFGKFFNEEGEPRPEIIEKCQNTGNTGYDDKRVFDENKPEEEENKGKINFDGLVEYDKIEIRNQIAEVISDATESPDITPEELQERIRNIELSKYYSNKVNLWGNSENILQQLGCDNNPFIKQKVKGLFGKRVELRSMSESEIYTFLILSNPNLYRADYIKAELLEKQDKDSENTQKYSDARAVINDMWRGMQNVVENWTGKAMYNPDGVGLKDENGYIAQLNNTKDKKVRETIFDLAKRVGGKLLEAAKNNMYWKHTVTVDKNAVNNGDEIEEGNKEPANNDPNVLLAGM